MVYKYHWQYVVKISKEKVLMMIVRYVVFTTNVYVSELFSVVIGENLRCLYYFFSSVVLTASHFF